MSKCALIKNGVVINVISVDADYSVVVDQNFSVNAGDLYDKNSGTFTKDPILAEADRLAAQLAQQG